MKNRIKVLLLLLIIIFSIFTHLIITKAEDTNSVTEVIEISGQIKDENGTILSGVEVFDKGDYKATTDDNGNYAFFTEKGNVEISYKKDGYEYSTNESKEIKYNGANSELANLEKLKFAFLEKENQEPIKLAIAGRLKYLISSISGIKLQVCSQKPLDEWIKTPMQAWITTLSEESAEGKGANKTCETIGFAQINDEEKQDFIDKLQDKSMQYMRFNIYANTQSAIIGAKNNVYTSENDWLPLLNRFTVNYSIKKEAQDKTIDFTDGVAKIDAKNDLEINVVLKKVDDVDTPGGRRLYSKANRSKCYCCGRYCNR